MAIAVSTLLTTLLFCMLPALHGRLCLAVYVVSYSYIIDAGRLGMGEKTVYSTTCERKLITMS